MTVIEHFAEAARLCEQLAEADEDHAGAAGLTNAEREAKTGLARLHLDIARQAAVLLDYAEGGGAKAQRRAADQARALLGQPVIEHVLPGERAAERALMHHFHGQLATGVLDEADVRAGALAAVHAARKAGES